MWGDHRKCNIKDTIPAHTNLVFNVRFEKTAGEFLKSSSCVNAVESVHVSYSIILQYNNIEMLKLMI